MKYVRNQVAYSYIQLTKELLLFVREGTDIQSHSKKVEELLSLSPDSKI